MLAILFACFSLFNSCVPDPDDGDEQNGEEDTEIVSPEYVSIDWENTTIISSNDSIGEYQISFLEKFLM